MTAFLSIKNLKVEFKTKELYVKALKGVSLDLSASETLGLVGESGSGKSLTALSIMRLIPEPPGEITEGQIFLEGKDLLQLPEKSMRLIRGNRISMIFQEPMTSLNPVFTVGWQIDEALMLHQKLNKKTARERTIELLDQVGIAQPRQRVSSYPHEMSGGQRQRVMIAMAIACQPDLLIADEPTTALDVTTQRQILQLIKKLQEQLKMSVLFISHDLGIIAEIAQKTALMYRGEIVEEGETHQIFKHPKQTYTKGLIACRPRMDMELERLPVLSDFMEEDGGSAEAEGQSGPLMEKDEDASSSGEQTTPSKKNRGKGNNSVMTKREEQKLLSKENPPPVSSKPSDEVLLELRDIKKHFPLKKSFFGKPKSFIKAVDGVSLKTTKASSLGLVGESGCGKTTLGRIILQLIPSSSGTVLYKGRDISHLNKKKLKALRKSLQIIFQDPYASLNPRMTVGDSIMEPMIIHKLFKSREERVERAESLMEQTGLDKNMLNRYPHEFSGGQRQRICIARAISAEPEFIVCDESVSSLDVSIQAQILNLLKDLKERMGLTYIFISHDLAVVKFISDQIAVMQEGKIVEQASAHAITSKPQHSYTQHLIEAIPSQSVLSYRPPI